MTVCVNLVFLFSFVCRFETATQSTCSEIIVKRLSPRTQQGNAQYENRTSYIKTTNSAFKPTDLCLSVPLLILDTSRHWASTTEITFEKRKLLYSTKILIN